MAYVFVSSIRSFAICCTSVELSVYGRLNYLMSCCKFSAINFLRVAEGIGYSLIGTQHCAKFNLERKC